MNEPLITVLLLFVIFGVSLWAWEVPRIEQKLIFRPEAILAQKEYYRLVTCSFLHAGWGHLLLNIYVLHQFGGVIERLFGPGHFLLIYFGSVIGGDLLSLLIHRQHDYSAYGASGGVCGLVFAYVLAFPHSQMSIFTLPYLVPGWFFAMAFVVASFYAMKAQRDNIGHDAHLGGSIIGLIIAAWLRPELVRQHGAVFVSLLFVSSLIFAYLVFNPLGLPLSNFLSTPNFGIKRRAPRRPTRAPVPPRNRPVDSKRLAASNFGTPQSDWLIQEIEDQVGQLHRDTSGLHDWVDKFGRTYDVVGGRAESFQMASFSAAILDHLNAPSVQFVVVDTRGLDDNQVALIRPFVADLPDAQFNRLIRSYGFNSRQRRP